PRPYHRWRGRPRLGLPPVLGHACLYHPGYCRFSFHKTYHRVFRQDDDLEPFGTPCPCLYGLCGHHHLRLACRGDPVPPALLRDLPWLCFRSSPLCACRDLRLPPPPDDPAGRYPEWCRCYSRVLSLLTGMGV